MNIFSKVHYRQILSEVIEERKRSDPKINFQKMAEYCRIPKSYLSKVIHGYAEVNSDQLYLICEFLKFDENEANYMQLLLEYARCGLKKRKDTLLKHIHHLQDQNFEIKKHMQIPVVEESNLQIVNYYLDPMMQLLHMALTIDKYRHDPNLLLSALKIKPNRLLSCLNQLEKMQLIQRDKQEFKVLVDKLHLPKNSPLYKGWRNQLKLLAINRVDTLDEHHDYSFSVIFSSDPETRKNIQTLFLEFLKKVEMMVDESEKSGVYQMSFEIFPWIVS